jgi:hypothetical protein
LTNRLDPFIRLQVQKRGITIFQNIYTGFDTEYELEDYNKSLNKLISTQLAVQARTIIKVPLYKPLDISYVHPLTSEISSFYPPKVEEWTPPSITGDEPESKKGKKLSELKLINESMKFCILSLRQENFTHFDVLNKDLVASLKTIGDGDGGGVISYEDNRIDSLIISLPLTPLHTKINYPSKGYSMKDLIQDSKEGSYVHLQANFKEVLKLVQSHNLKTSYDKLMT